MPISFQSERRTDGDDRFYKMVTRLRPSQLGTGELALSENGRMDVDGTWKCRDGYENVSGVVLSTASVPLTWEADHAAALFLVANSAGTDTAALASNVVTVTVAAGHGLPVAPPATFLINLSGFATGGAGPDINGNRTVTRTGATTYTFPLTGADDPGYTGGTTKSFELSTGAVAIYGSCLFSDPSNSNQDYILIADDVRATAVNVSTLAHTVIAYPTGETLAQDADLIQEFGTVTLRQNGKTSWTWDGDLSGTPAFTKMATGAKTQPVDLVDATTTISTAGKVSMTNAGGNHNLATGDKIKIISGGTTDLVEGDTYIVTVDDADDFHFYANISTTGTGSSVTVRATVSLGGGYINAPGAPWGIYHQRRAWLPYSYTSANPPVDRGVRDEIIASDLLDNQTFDPIGNQFRITAGTADFIVDLHGFDDDRLLVFNRNSIHYLTGISGTLDDVRTIQLTDEIGCLARKSVVSYANQVLFLSDQGVYALSFQDEYNLRGVELPLSEAIDNLIHRITKSAADNAVAVYHNNRYWLAVPLDGCTTNSAILIYNFINGGWESIDTTNATDSGWDILDLITARSGKVAELYAVTRNGGVHKIDDTGRELDLIAGEPGQIAETVYAIPAAATTRQYTFGDLRRKKFNRLRCHLKSSAAFISQGEFSLIVEDPDDTIAIGAIRDEFTDGVPSGEDATWQARLGNPRGFAAQVKFSVESGLPSLRAIQLDAVGAFESTTSVS